MVFLKAKSKMINSGSLKEANVTVKFSDGRNRNEMCCLYSRRLGGGLEMSCLACYLSRCLLIVLARLAFWSGVYSTPSSLWNIVITQSHTSQPLLSLNSVWKQRWLLRRKQCYGGMKSFLWSIHPRIFTYAPSLNELQSKCFIYSS